MCGSAYIYQWLICILKYSEKIQRDIRCLAAFVTFSDTIKTLVYKHIISAIVAAARNYVRILSFQVRCECKHPTSAVITIIN